MLDQERLQNMAKLHKEHPHEFNQLLLLNIKDSLPYLKEQQSEADREFGARDLFYRFYYQSFKVYRIQYYTIDWTDFFRQLGGGVALDPWYEKIVEEGSNKSFDMSHNQNWLKHTRPIMEAYFHSRMFLDQMVWCAENMDTAPFMLPSPWAAVLCLYRTR